ncbi:MAG TPA: YCF48-related protein, partial [Xanthomonadales bacterium]|nr:YCF48-related protein [Xanthomonadales bacterium]
PATSQWPDPATAPAEILDISRIQTSLLIDGTNARDRAVVVGDRGHILVSESRSEWRQVPVPTRTMLTAVTAVDNAVWAVGHDQVVIYSADGGLTWTLQHSSTTADGPLLDVLFLDAQRGIAIGAYGQYLSTTDSGASWTEQLISDRVASAAAAVADEEAVVDEDSELASTDMGEDEGDPHLNAIVRTSAGLLILGEAGASYRSTDDGATWLRGNLPYEGSMFGAVALDTNDVVAFGLRGNAFGSSDLGLTWRKLETGTEASLLGGAPVAGGRAVIVGASGTVLLLPAGSDQMRGYTFPDGGVMSGVLPLTETEFLTIGENGLAPYQPN